MNIFSRFLAALASLFVSAEKIAGKIYNNLPEQDQLALQKGSGIIAIINANLTAVPSKVRTLITVHFPAVNESELERSILKVAQSFGLQAGNNLDETITNIQAYLTKVPKGNFWVVFTTGLSLGVSLVFGGAGAKAEVYLQVIKYVYDKIIKPAIEKKQIINNQ